MTMITKLFGIDLPLIQAPMAGAQGSALAIAVANAGGLGSLPGAMLDAAGLRAELIALRAGTSRPVNVNFFCHRMPATDTARELAWQALLAPYRAELGIDKEPPAKPASRQPFSAETLAVLAEFRPPVLSFHFGLPDEALLAPARAWGAKILSTATTVAEARWLEARGADAIIAQGLEAGGHRGHFLDHDLTRQMGTMALVRQLVTRVRVPVIAAGGIADAQGVAAAFALGASGVQVGTTFLRCPEATISELYRAALSQPDADHTALTNLFTGRPARGIVNRLMRELGPLNPAAPEFPQAATTIAPLRAAAERLGSADFSPLWAGQNTSGCRDVAAATLLRSLYPAGTAGHDQ